MTADFSAGDRELDTRAECSLVVSWCDQFDDRLFENEEPRDRLGSVDFSAKTVARADAAIPYDVASAKAAGFKVVDGDDRAFVSARAFLASAAQTGESITGNW